MEAAASPRRADAPALRPAGRARAHPRARADPRRARRGVRRRLPDQRAVHDHARPAPATSARASACSTSLAWLHLEVLGRGRRLLLLQGPRRAGAVRRADRPRAARRSSCCTGCAASAGCPGTPTSATPGIVTNTGSLGMGISKAKGMVLADRLHGATPARLRADRRRRAAGGPDLGVARPGGERGLGEITAIVDHNKIQSDTWVDAGQRPRRPRGARSRAFGWAVARCDGHDVGARSARRSSELLDGEPDRPKVIIADTRQGRRRRRSWSRTTLERCGHRAVPLPHRRARRRALRRARSPSSSARLARAARRSASSALERARPAPRAPRARRARSGWSAAYGEALAARGRARAAARGARRRPRAGHAA